MSRVRVPVGTRKGAFILESDGNPAVERQRPIFCRLGDLPPEGISSRPESDLCRRNPAAGSGS